MLQIKQTILQTQELALVRRTLRLVVHPTMINIGRLTEAVGIGLKTSALLVRLQKRRCLLALDLTGMVRRMVLSCRPLELR